MRQYERERQQIVRTPRVEMRCLTLKTPSRNSKGLACLRFEGYPGERYPREMILSLKRDWYFFWFSSWNYTLKDIPYHDCIDIFIAWDDLLEEIKRCGRRDCILVRGGCETAQRHDLLFCPRRIVESDVDLLYIARFIKEKRCDIALECVRHLAHHIPGVQAVFLESLNSDVAVREWVFRQRELWGLENNLTIQSVPLEHVNTLLNRAKISLFTSDEEGLCRAVVQSLLAERPVLCYRYTRALTRSLYNDKYFYYYHEQRGESCARAAIELFNMGVISNTGARQYVLNEKGIVFLDEVEWREQVLSAAECLYARDGQKLERKDLVPFDVARSQFWRPFEFVA